MEENIKLVEELFEIIDNEDVSMKDRNKALLLFLNKWNKEANDMVNAKLESGGYHVSLLKSSEIMTGKKFPVLDAYLNSHYIK